MISKFKRNIIKSIVFLGLILNSSILEAQNDSIPKPKSEFWKKVNFGGGIGFNIGSGFTNIALSPTMYYNVNSKVSLGLGLNGSYVKSSGEYNAWIYGGSIVGIINPVDFIQLSSELEQLRANVNYQTTGGSLKDNFWNTALFLGAGYRSENFTIGLRYNVLHDKTDRLYSDPWMPFVRIIF
ncbi:MAG: hypothetical protein V4670_06745 [Bacteroidota bacterium]